MSRFLTEDEIGNILDFIKPGKNIPLDSALSITDKVKERFKNQLITQKIYPELIPELKNQLKKNYFESLIQPGESIGIIAAQSIGEKNTQNSVIYDEKILIKKNGNVFKTTVGNLIENEMKSGVVFNLDKKNFVKYVSNIEILTVSQEEKIEWKKVTELSKHPTNGDLVKIKTQSGREVITTLSHSHLKKDKDAIIPVLGSELKLGDRIPVIKKMPIIEKLDFVYISDYIEFDKIDNEYIHINKTKIKNKIYLDENFGWFIGAYLSEGNCTEYNTSITNINPEFKENIKKFCLTYDLTYRTTTKYGNTPSMKDALYESVTHHINSIILSKFITKLCNTGSINKKLPKFIYESNKKFISNVIKGYMDGDGNVSTGKNKEIRAHSICKLLLEEFRVLFTYFGIFTTISIQKSKNDYQLTIYGKQDIKKYKEQIGTDLPYKMEALNNLLINTKDDFSSRLERITYNIGRHITKISSMLSLKGHSRTYSRYERLNDDIGRNTLGRFIKIFKDESKKKSIDISENLKYCEMSYNSDIIWDRITEITIIKEKDYKYDYVYDFSVKGNETFALFSGIVVHNTLNSVDWLEKIVYIKQHVLPTVEPIGKMVDNLLLNDPENIQYIEENRTEYLKLKDGYYIPSCDEFGNTNWYKIEAVTRHLPVGKLVKVKTESGREVTATQSKSFLVWNEEQQKFLAVAGSDVKVGDILPTTQSLVRPNNTIESFDYVNSVNCDNGKKKEYKKIILNREIGFFIGLFLTGEIENYIANDDIKIRYDKLKDIYNINLLDFFDEITLSGTIIPTFSYNSPDEYIRGLLLGFFRNCLYDNDSILCVSYYEDVINGILFLLSYYGVFGYFIIVDIDFIYKLEIKNDKREILDELWDVDELKKQKDLNVYFDKVVSIEFVNGSTEYVYDLTVENTRNFQLFNGLNIRDTFHKAGQSEKTVIQGVPRFLELLNASKNPRIVNCKIFFKEMNKTVQELKENIAYNLVCLTFKDLIKSVEVVLNKEPESWYDVFKILYNDNFEDYEHCLSVKLNSELMFKYKINVNDIAKIIEKEYTDLYCVFSPINNEILDIYVDVSNIKLDKEKLLFVTSENINEIYIEECVQPILEKLIICGIEGISSIYYTHENDEWFVETDGTNFKKLLGHPIIDMTRLHSNNVWDVYENLGIEASREFLINEFISIMEGINSCHVKLLVDKMTYTGTISSISRYTLRKDESGPCSKASFEESIEIFLKASFAGDIEKTKGVSASIICGKRARCGTGFVDLKIDVEQLKNAIPVFLDKDNEGVVVEQKAITKIKPFVGRI